MWHTLFKEDSGRSLQRLIKVVFKVTLMPVTFKIVERQIVFADTRGDVVENFNCANVSSVNTIS